MKYLIEIGRYKGKYKLFRTAKTLSEAIAIYNGYNIGNGYKKRLRLQIDSRVYKPADKSEPFGLWTKQKESKFYTLIRYIS